MPDKIVALICAHNEQSSIGPIIHSLREFTQKRTGWKKILPPRKIISRVIVVDDGSSDRTALTSRLWGASVVRLPVNKGKTTAFYHGVRAAAKLKPDILLMLDADLEDVTQRQIERLLEPVKTRRVQMSKGDMYGDVVDLTGQRAIRFSVFEPLLRNNPKWENYFGIKNGQFTRDRRYGLETALNILIRKSEEVNTQFRTVRGYGVRTGTAQQDREALNMVRIFHGRYRFAKKLREMRYEKRPIKKRGTKKPRATNKK